MQRQHISKQSHTIQIEEYRDNISTNSYQIFKNQLGRIMEGYVDDMFVKSMNFKQYLLDFKKVFNVLSQYQIKLKPFQICFRHQG